MICSLPNRPLAGAFAALALCLFTGSALAQNAASKAEVHLTRGQKLFADGKYPDAIEELRAGYVLSPQPRFLYALGQAYRLNHQCVEAVKAYRDFIGSEPPRSQATAAEGNVARCGEEDPRSIQPIKVEPVQPDPSVTKPSVVAPTLVVAAPVEPQPRKTPTYKKWWPWTILGGVVVVVGAGVGLGLGLRGGSDFKSTLPDVGPGAAMGLTLR